MLLPPPLEEVSVAHRMVSSLLVLIVAAGLGCASASPNEAAAPTDTSPPVADSAPTATADAPPPPPSKPSSSGSGDLSEDQKKQMEIALRRGGDKAANCASVVPDAPRGEGEVKVTFDGKKGRATEVAVGAPWAGTPAEACIKRSFVGEIVVPFDGELEVPYTVKLPPREGDDKGKKNTPKKK